MADDQWHPAVLLVGEGPFLAKAVGSGHFTVIGGVDNNGVIRLPAFLKGLQYLIDLTRHVTQAIEVVTLVGQPGGFVIFIDMTINVVYQFGVGLLAPGFVVQ